MLSAVVALTVASALADQLMISGSDKLGAQFIPRVAEAFKAEHPATSINISVPGYSLSSLPDGRAIYMRVGKAGAAELQAAVDRGFALHGTVVGYDALVVIVNAASPLTKITSKQIEQIFAGEVADWKEVGGSSGLISLYIRNSSSGAYRDFKSLAMQGREYAAGAQRMAGGVQIAAAVAQDPMGIGFVNMADAKAGGIKILRPDGVEMSDERVRSGAYPFTQKLYLYTRGVPAGETKAFIDFAAGAEGRKMAREAGFVPAFDADLVLKGSDTLGAKLVPQLSEGYKKLHPDTTFSIAAEGSTTGIAAIIDGTAHIGMSARQPNAAEREAAKQNGVTFHETVVAIDGLAIAVHEANPVTHLTRKQVEKIFAGDVKDWSEVGGQPGKIAVHTRNTSSGTYKDFKLLAMNGRDYAPGGQKMMGSEQPAALIGRDPNGIGYLGIAYVKASGVKIVTIDRVEITDENLRNRKYPYARATYFYTNGPPMGEVKNYIDFAFSEEGRKVVRQVGFVPVK